MPEDVRRVFGAALSDAQMGDWPAGARPFGEGVSRQVLKLVEDAPSGTYRVAFTLAFPGRIYVLHAFHKKAVRGIATPAREIATVVARFQAAREHFEAEAEQ